MSKEWNREEYMTTAEAKRLNKGYKVMKNKLEMAIEALEFYGNSSNYGIDEDGFFISSDSSGGRAREALEKIKEMK